MEDRWLARRADEAYEEHLKDPGQAVPHEQLWAEIEADPFIVSVMEAFPGAKIGEIKTIAQPMELPAIPDEAVEED